MPSAVGGPVEKMSFFQIAPMTKVSTQIHSSMYQYQKHSTRLIMMTRANVAISPMRM